MARTLKNLEGKFCKIYVNSLARLALEDIFSEKLGDALKEKRPMPIALRAKIDTVEERGLWITEARIQGNLDQSAYFVSFDAIAFVNLIEKGTEKREEK